MNGSVSMASSRTAPEAIPSPPPGPARASRPRVLLLTDRLERDDTGEILLAAAPRLQREGFEVLVGSLGPWGPLGDELERRGARAVALGVRSLFDPRGVGRLLSLLRRERIQIVHGYLSAANLAARICGRLAGVPVVVTTHHDIDRSRGLAGRLLQRLTAPLSDAVVASSEAVRRHAAEACGVRPGLLRTLYAAVEPPGAGATPPARRETIRRELGAGPGDLLIGTAGEIREPEKGLTVFLTAAGRLAREFPNARFAIAGDGPDRARLEGRAAEEGVSHRTVFAGARDDLPGVVEAFDLFVLPSLWEGFGLMLLHAMEAGTPIVASRVGGVPEVVADGETGVLVPPGDAPALAAACAALLRNRERAERLAAAGRERLRGTFPVGRLVRDTASFYRDLLARVRSEGERSPAAPGRVR